MSQEIRGPRLETHYLILQPILCIVRRNAECLHKKQARAWSGFIERA
jgi:hypothetical protein